MLRIFIAIIFCGAAGISGCFKQPELVGIDDIEVLSVVDTFVEVNVLCYVSNPNILGATIKKITGDVMVNGKNIGFIEQKSAIKIDKSKTEKVRLHAFIHVEQLSRLFPDIIQDSLSTVEVNGRAEIDGGVTSIGKNLKMKKSLYMKPIVEHVIANQLSENTINVKKIIPKQLGTQNSKVEIGLEFSNPLKIDFTVHQVLADIYINDEHSAIAKWTNDAQVMVKANSKALMEGVTTLENGNIFAQGGDMLSFFFKREVRVKGNAVVSLLGHRFEIPFKQMVEVTYKGF